MIFEILWNVFYVITITAFVLLTVRVNATSVGLGCFVMFNVIFVLMVIVRWMDCVYVKMVGCLLIVFGLRFFYLLLNLNLWRD